MIPILWWGRFQDPASASKSLVQGFWASSYNSFAFSVFSAGRTSDQNRTLKRYLLSPHPEACQCVFWLRCTTCDNGKCDFQGSRITIAVKLHARWQAQNCTVEAGRITNFTPHILLHTSIRDMVHVGIPFGHKKAPIQQFVGRLGPFEMHLSCLFSVSSMYLTLGRSALHGGFKGRYRALHKVWQLVTRPPKPRPPRGAPRRSIARRSPQRKLKALLRVATRPALETRWS